MACQVDGIAWSNAIASSAGPSVRWVAKAYSPRRSSEPCWKNASIWRYTASRISPPTQWRGSAWQRCRNGKQSATPLSAESQLLWPTCLTAPGLERVITEGLRGDYLISPEVTVRIEEYRPFFLKGAVNGPGSYEYQPGLTLEKALVLGGGLSPRAARGKIEVKRANSDSFVRIQMNDPVYPDDVINVPESFF